MNLDLSAPIPQRLRTRQPMLWAALAHANGILVGHYAWRPASWWLFAALVFAF
jgi:hypothetical protein